VRKKMKYVGGSVLLHRMEFLKARTFMWWNIAEFSSHWLAGYLFFFARFNYSFPVYFVEIPS
jgi:hypothetical protein